MKSFKDHQTEELNKKVKLDEATAGDFLLGLGVAGGLYALKKGWDKWGKGSGLAKSLAFTDKQKAKVAQDKIDKADEKQKGKDTEADAAAMDYEKDAEGNIKKVKDAQTYKDKTDKAPSGWETSSGKGAFKKVKAGDVVQKGVADMLRKRYEAERNKQGQKLGAGETETGDEREKRKEDEKAAKEKEAAKKKESLTIYAKDGLLKLTESDRHEVLKTLKGIMTITESNELQAIMALDDVGISAEINRKGEVVVKKKDLKKAQKALKKSFRKGGEPDLKVEEVELDEALKPLDKSVIDAFYYKKEKAGKVVSTDGDTLWKDGMGGQTIAQWLNPSGKIAISAVTDVKSTESILKYMKKSIPKGNFDKKSYKKFFGEELQRTAYELVSEARKKSIANKPKWEQE